MRAALGCAARHPRHRHPLPHRYPVRGRQGAQYRCPRTAAPALAAGHPVKDSLDALAADPFLAARFAGRDPDAGYNAWDRYAEEDAAQALDQFLNTRLGRNSRGDPVTRWATADGGMHVLALLLYDTLRRGGFDPRVSSYADFLARALSDPHTWPDDLNARYLELAVTRQS